MLARLFFTRCATECSASAGNDDVASCVAGCDLAIKALATGARASNTILLFEEPDYFVHKTLSAAEREEIAMKSASLRNAMRNACAKLECERAFDKDHVGACMQGCDYLFNKL